LGEGVRFETLRAHHSPDVDQRLALPAKERALGHRELLGETPHEFTREQSFTDVAPKGRLVLKGHVYLLVGHDQTLT
jgi:hypothetical protein